MALASGSKLGPYEIVAPLGAGGMGEVYRARDTRLDRTVAIKVLPPELSANPDRRQRFEREARTISSLNHPHICTLHDIGRQEGIDYLVMEYVEGETLAKKLEGGPLHTEAVLRYGIEIADALDKAHRQGVIHRDLKPGNIMLTKSGAKLLDFGLAKVLPHPGELLSATAPTAAPTASKPLTSEGTLLGTLQYMSPEQLEGKEADARTDIFAFGTVLYEMAVGRPAFHAKSTASLIAAILTSEPQPITTLQPMTPPALDRLVKTCLAKDRDDRWQTVHDLMVQLKWMAEGHSSVAAVSSPSPDTRTALLQRRTILWSLAALAVLSIGVALWSLLRAPQPPTRPVARLVVTLPAADRLTIGYLPHIALAPDGSRLVYVANHGGSTQLHVRAIDRFEATPVPGTEGAESPFFSPDGQSVGFFAGGKLKKVSLSGGAPLTLCNTLTNRGGSWGPDDTIIFTPAAASGLFRVSAAGGTPKPLTILDRTKGESSHRWPDVLPGGKALLFTNWRGGSYDDAQIGLLSLETGERRVLVEGGAYAQYIPSGHLVYARAGGLLAVPFDLKRLEVTGPPASILEGVTMNPSFGSAEFSSSADGSLAYVPGGSSLGDRTLLWVDRKGVARPLPAPPRAYISPRLSPDGQRLAVGSEGTGAWLYDLARGTLTRLTETAGALPLLIWTPDGKHVTFRSMVSSSLNLHWMPADGSGVAERLTTSENMQSPGSWSPGGQVLAFSEQDSTSGWDIWVLKLEGDRKPQPFLQTPFNEGAPMFSPDGRWLAYQSDESGRLEIYVRSFPGPGGKWPISTEGGTEPVWARNGRELFYRDGDKMMAAAVETKPTFAAARPKLLFEGHYETGIFSFQPNYDVSPDGQRFLMIKPSEQESAATQLNVVLNWSDEVRRLVPAGGK